MVEEPAMERGAQEHSLVILGRRRGRSARTRVERRDFRNPPQPTGPQLRELEALSSRVAAQVGATIENVLKSTVRCEANPPAVRAWADVVEEVSRDVWVLPLVAENHERAALFIDVGLQRHLVVRLLGGHAETSETAEAQHGEDPEMEPESSEEAGGASQSEDPHGGAEPPVGEISRAALMPLVRSLIDDLGALLRDEAASPGESAGGRWGLDEARRLTAPRRWMRSAEAVTEFSFAVREGSGSGTIRLVVQSHSLLHLLRVEDGGVVAQRSDTTRGRLETVVRDLGMSVSLRLGGASIDLSEFLRLQKGDVLVLDRRVGEPLDVLVGDQRRFVGQPGRSRGRLAVRIIGRSDPKETT